MKTTLELDLPTDFMMASELYNIRLESAIECYTNHVTIYNFLFKEQDNLNDTATAIFKKYHNNLLAREGIKISKNAKSYKKPFLEILRLGIGEKGSHSREYRNVINESYKMISKTRKA